MTSLANALDPSNCAAAALGPKQAMPLARTASATPATSGASGPTTTRSAASSTARAATAAGSVAVTSYSEATCAMPGLPGAAARKSTEGSAARPTARACSRPPDPIRSTRTAADPTGALLPHVAQQGSRVNFGSTRASPSTTCQTEGVIEVPVIVLVGAQWG